MAILRMTMMCSIVLFSQPIFAGEDDTNSKANVSKSSEQSTPTVLVVLVFDQNCHKWCNEVRPILAELKEKYKDRVTFDELDASDNIIKQTQRKAKELGIASDFLPGTTDYIPMVAVFPANRRNRAELTGYKQKEVYENAIEKALHH